MLLGAPNIFAGAPNTCSEKVVIPLTYFLKNNARLSLSRSACIFASSSCVFFSSSSQRFVLLLPHLSHFHIIVAHVTGVFHLLLPLRGGCGKRFFFFFVEELATIVVVNRRLSWCIEEASVKSNAVVHRRGSFVTVHHRGKRRDH